MTADAARAPGAPPFRPRDPAFLQDPYPTYRRLRAEAPIAFYAPWNAWLVMRHADVTRLLRDRRTARVAPPEGGAAIRPGLEPFDAIQAGSLLEIEPPDHTRIKQVVQEVFTPRHVRALGGRIAALTESLADALAAAGDAPDLLTVFAEPLPVTVIAELLGVPEADRHRLLPWSKAIIGMFEPERTAEMERAAVSAAAAFADYVRWLAARRLEAPADDLIGRMVAVRQQDPERLSEGELVANAILFLDAGHEAVVNVLGNGLHALLTHSDQRDRLLADPALVPTAVEEMLRYDTPLQFFERVFLDDVPLAGHTFRRGERACLYYASANRDEAVFAEPDAFDVAREPNPHVAFGLGVHYCIGAPLARLELQAAVTTLLRRFPTMRVVDEAPRYQPRNVFRYLTELRVRP